MCVAPRRYPLRLSAPRSVSFVAAFGSAPRAMSSLTASRRPLAAAKISLFAVSTFDTDYLLVASEALLAAVAALERAGHTVNRSATE